tara:strand:+ start:686 stop:1279 length:594 start_codon:yes stop_codon:yes gene_type:complete
MKLNNIHMQNIISNGMSMIEMIFSLLLVTIFMATSVSILNLTSIILGKSNSQINGKFTKSADNYLSQGVIIDQYKLQTSMDLYIETLAQPGITLEKINNIKSTQYGNLLKGCSLSPLLDWNIPVKQNPLSNENWSPSSINYAICLRSTSLAESTLSDLINNSSGAKPGIYVLLALPEKVTTNSLPARRVFCRPDPYC